MFVVAGPACFSDGAVGVDRNEVFLITEFFFAALGDAVVDPALAAMRAQLQALAASGVSESSQALKLVSILFLDVVGSTALAQQLDPEDVGVVLDGVLVRGTAIVQAHGGSVLQYAGDSLLAVFGNPKAAEDDAERAVRCGLALVALGRRLAAGLPGASRPVPVLNRVGSRGNGSADRPPLHPKASGSEALRRATKSDSPSAMPASSGGATYSPSIFDTRALARCIESCAPASAQVSKGR